MCVYLNLLFVNQCSPFLLDLGDPTKGVQIIISHDLLPWISGTLPDMLVKVLPLDVCSEWLPEVLQKTILRTCFFSCNLQLKKMETKLSPSTLVNMEGKVGHIGLGKWVSCMIFVIYSTILNGVNRYMVAEALTCDCLHLKQYQWVENCFCSPH